MDSRTKNEDKSVRRATPSQPSLLFSTKAAMTINEEFETFWASFPRRVGKLAALREYEKARVRASAEDILAGVERYKRAKPEYADWCHPRTFLFQGRWMDEDDQPVELPAKVECPHDPRCGSKVWCATLREREADGWERTA